MLSILISNLIFGTAVGSPTDGFWSILETATDYAKTIWDLKYVILVPCIVICTIIFGISKYSFRKLLAEELNNKPNEVKLDEKSYIKHNFYFNKDRDSKKSYDQFYKEIKNKRNIVLVSTAGLGKTMLMQKLAFKFRNKNIVTIKGLFQLFQNQTFTMDDFGIIYFVCLGNYDLTKLNNRIQDFKKSNPKKELLL